MSGRRLAVFLALVLAAADEAPVPPGTEAVVDQISTVRVDGDKANERVEMKVTVREKAPE
jgi:hypothetical protein